MRAPAPAPDLTVTSTCARPRRWTTSGTMATRCSPEADSLGTPSFMRPGREPIDQSIGLLAPPLRLPVELGPDAERAQDRIRLVQVGGVPDRQGQPGGRPYRGRDQEEERDGGQRGEGHGAAAIADRHVTADAAEGAHGRGS